MDIKESMFLATMYQSAEARANQTLKPTDKLGDDGLYMCTVCDEPTQYIHGYEGRDYKLARQCACDREEVAQREADKERRDKLYLIEALKKKSFPNFRFREFTFKGDDGRNAKTSKFCKSWADNYKRMRDENIGIMFYGGTGTGKSYFASAIANEVIEKQLATVKMIDMNTLLNKTTSFETRQQTLDSLEGVDLLIIDDFGTSRNTEFVWENVYTIINNRYMEGKLLIVTTNLAPSDFDPESKDMPLDQARVFDRILEMCPLEIKMSGGSRRKGSWNSKVDTAREIMEGGRSGSST